MAHGAGGKASRRLVEGLFAPLLFGSAVPGRWATPRTSISTERRSRITTDSFVVKPLTFPGGSIGELAVNGTVNDLAVSGARGEALVVTYVLEAGLPTDLCSRRKFAPWAKPRGERECGSRAATQK